MRAWSAWLAPWSLCTFAYLHVWGRGRRESISRTTLVACNALATRRAAERSCVQVRQSPRAVKTRARTPAPSPLARTLEKTRTMARLCRRLPALKTRTVRPYLPRMPRTLRRFLPDHLTALRCIASSCSGMNVLPLFILRTHTRTHPPRNMWQTMRAFSSRYLQPAVSVRIDIPFALFLDILSFSEDCAHLLVGVDLI